MTTLLERLQPERIRMIADMVESLILERRGQRPAILLHQARARLQDFDITVVDMQLVFDYLEEKGRIFPHQELDRTILGWVYVPRRNPLSTHY